MTELQVWGRPGGGEAVFYASFEPKDWQFAQKLALYLADKGCTDVAVREVEEVEQQPESTKIFVISFFLSAFAGLAALLRSGGALTWVRVLSAALNSGLVGLGIALLWYVKFQENLYFLVGVCVVAGLGGMATVELVLAAFRRGLGVKNDRENPHD